MKNKLQQLQALFCPFEPAILEEAIEISEKVGESVEWIFNLTKEYRCEPRELNLITAIHQRISSDVIRIFASLLDKNSVSSTQYLGVEFKDGKYQPRNINHLKRIKIHAKLLNSLDAQPKVSYFINMCLEQEEALKIKDSQTTKDRIQALKDCIERQESQIKLLEEKINSN